MHENDRNKYMHCKVIILRLKLDRKGTVENVSICGKVYKYDSIMTKKCTTDKVSQKRDKKITKGTLVVWTEI